MQIYSLSPIGYPSLRRAEQGTSCVVVGLRITKSTASVNLLGDNRTSTLASVETTAAICAIGVAGARTGDELCSSTITSAVASGRCLGGGGDSGRLGRGLGDCSGSSTAKQRESRVAIGLCITKPTASVTFLGDDRTSTLAGVEAAAAICAIGVAGARTGDELCSSTITSAVASGRCLGGGGDSGRLGRGLGDCSGSSTAKQRESRVAIGLCITKPTASVTFLSDDRARTLAGVEAAAAVCTIGVAGTRTSNELCALTDDQKGH